MRSMLFALAVAALAIVSSGCCSSRSCGLAGGGSAFNDGCPGGLLGRGCLRKRRASAEYGSDVIMSDSSCGCSSGDVSMDGGCGCSGGVVDAGFSSGGPQMGLGLFERGAMCGECNQRGCRGGCQLIGRVAKRTGGVALRAGGAVKRAGGALSRVVSCSSCGVEGCGGGCRLLGRRSAGASQTLSDSGFASGPIDQPAQGCGLASCGVGGHGCGLGCGLRLAKGLASGVGSIGRGVGSIGNGGLQSINHPYGGQVPHTNPALGPQGGAGGFAPTYQYPYYTTRGPRDFLNGNPPTIGPR